MTTLRETLARAIDPLAFAMNDYIEAGIHKRAKARSAASIVLRALAKWEPSDAVVRGAAMVPQLDEYSHEHWVKRIIGEALRAMADET